MNINVLKGTFCGGEIEPGTFHAGLTPEMLGMKFDDEKEDKNASEQKSSEANESTEDSENETD